MSKPLTYADLLGEEWRVSSRRLQSCLRRVFRELCAETLVSLRKEPRLQIATSGHNSVWAYFPMHRRRWIVRSLGIELKPETRILLVFNDVIIDGQPAKQSEAELRDHLGHTLLYLRAPKAPNDCRNALKEWDRCCSDLTRRRWTEGVQTNRLI
jgi:hypothetical protein